MQLDTNVRNYRLVLSNGKERYTIAVNRETADEAGMFKDRRGKYKGSAFFDLQDEDGNYMASIDRNDLKGIEGPKARKGPAKGYYCAWGAYHYADGPSCQHWHITGVPPQTMIRLRQEMYPNWADGIAGRPPRGYQGNAMTQTMQDAIVARARREDPGLPEGFTPPTPEEQKRIYEHTQVYQVSKSPF